MAYTSKLLLVAGLVMVPTASWSVSDALLWRVDGTGEERTSIPSYAGQSNPFPQKIEPVIIEEQEEIVEDVISPEELERQRRATRAIEILSEVRSLLRDDELFRADISAIQASAYMKVNGVPSALSSNKWMREGDAFTVPIMAREQLQSLLDELSGLSTELAKIVSDEVADRMVRVESFQVHVREIHEDRMVLEDEDGLMHVINISGAS